MLSFLVNFDSSVLLVPSLRSLSAPFAQCAALLIPRPSPFHPLVYSSSLCPSATSALVCPRAELHKESGLRFMVLCTLYESAFPQFIRLSGLAHALAKTLGWILSISELHPINSTLFHSRAQIEHNRAVQFTRNPSRFIGFRTVSITQGGGVARFICRRAAKGLLVCYSG
jgi:hypothetical protein